MSVSKAVGGRKVARGFESLPSVTRVRPEGGRPAPEGDGRRRGRREPPRARWRRGSRPRREARSPRSCPPPRGAEEPHSRAPEGGRPRSRAAPCLFARFFPPSLGDATARGDVLLVV